MENRFWLFFLSLFLPLNAVALDTAEKEVDSMYSFAVFGTLGYSITDQPYRYVRADEHGTFRQLSRIGVQFDAQFSPTLSATLQGELAPSTYKDHRYHPRLSWAFLTYRPNNNWTWRLGKIRIPMMMLAENIPVGASYARAQLPYEIFATAPVYDLTGASVGYTWNLKNNQELTWEGYAGFTNSYLRIFYRGGIPSFLPENSAYYLPFETPLFGTSVYWQDFERDHQARFKLFYAPVKERSGSKVWAKNPSRFMQYAPGKYSYIPVAGYDNVETYDRLRLLFLILSGCWNLGNDVYLTAEAVMRHSMNTNIGLNSTALYLLLHKRFGRWTPYVSLSGIQPVSKIRNYLKEMGEPTGVPFLDQMNMSSADNLVTMQQWSFVLGTAYDMKPNQRLKLEWMHTKIGNASAMVSARADQPFKHKAINMLSVSYNFLFDF